MRRSVRERNEALRLPIVDIDFVLQRFKDPRTTTLIHGARRQVVEKVVQMLETAKRNQIDGHVELDVRDVGLLLQAVALTVESMVDIIHWFDDDEQI